MSWRWDGRIIYTNFLAEDFCRVKVRRHKRTRVERGCVVVLH